MKHLSMKNNAQINKITILRKLKRGRLNDYGWGKDNFKLKIILCFVISLQHREAYKQLSINALDGGEN